MVKNQALAKLINAKFGEGTVKMASDPSLQIEKIPTGILSIDYLLGGGLPRGRHVEIFGNYSVGKTYTALRTIASVQAGGGSAAFIDAEGTFDPEFGRSIGVDLEALAFHRQEHGNRVIDFIETLLRGGDYDVIVLDSIAALLPKQEMEQDMEAGSYGTQQAKLMSAALRRLTAANRRTTLIYINQVRDAMGGFFQPKNTTSGGRAMGFYAGVRLEMTRIENIKKTTKVTDHKGVTKEAEVVKGHRVQVRVEKSKTGGTMPQSKVSFVFDYDLAGIDPIEDLVYIGQLAGLVHRRGNNWSIEEYEEEAQIGRNKFKSWLRKNKAIAEELEEKIRGTI